MARASIHKGTAQFETDRISHAKQRRQQSHRNAPDSDCSYTHVQHVTRMAGNGGSNPALGAMSPIYKNVIPNPSPMTYF